MKEIYPLSRMHFGSVLDACWDFFYHTYRADSWGNNRPFGRRVPAALSQENGESNCLSFDDATAFPHQHVCFI